MNIDVHMATCILTVSVAGGIIGLDRTALGQFMISEPIVAAPLAGLLLGDPVTGLLIGAVLELIWVLDMPVGSFVPADSTIGAVSATAIAVLASEGSRRLDMIGFSILVTSIMLPLTMTADKVIRTYNSRLAEGPLTASSDEAGSLLAKAQAKGAAAFFLKSFILYLLFIPAGLFAAGQFDGLPDEMHSAMSLFLKVLPLAGTALILRKLSFKTMNAFFLGGFIIAAVLAMLFPSHALLVILLVIAAGFLGSRYREGWL